MRLSAKIGCAILAAAIGLALSAGGKGEAAGLSAAYLHPAPSPAGVGILLSGPGDTGVYLLDADTRALLALSDHVSAGYAFSWSPDGAKAGFKGFVKTRSGEWWQYPAVFDSAAGAVRALAPASPRAGVPTFSRDGKTVFTVDRRLCVLDAAGALEASYDLGQYANLAPVSPDGTRVAYNDASDQIWLLDLTTGKRTRLTDGRAGWFWPIWSPDGAKLSICGVAGDLAVVDVAAPATHALGRGGRPSWAPDGGSLLYTRLRGEPGVKMDGSELVLSRWDGSAQTVLAATSSASPIEGAFDRSGAVVLCGGETGGLLRAPLETSLAGAARLGAPAGIVPGGAAGAVPLPAPAFAPPEEAASPEAVVSIPDVPYMHQVYDTPDWFNGNWACNATSALMAIAHYEILPCWDCTVSTPYSHVSHYGNYVCSIYSYDGFTYNTASPDPSGNDAWGGYGYIVRDDWADTRTYMRDFFANHGLDDVPVEWSPTWAKVQAEADAGYPVVYLTTITTSGHYIVGIGYVPGQHTAIFNDPYGNKNQGYPNWYGAGAMYDWPGYNNGYKNLNSVVCFIYARAAVQSCTSSGVFSLTSPANGELVPGTTTGATLSWSASGFADSYDVYFGTAADPPFYVNQTGTSVTVKVTAGTAYHWSVKARVNCRSTYACPAGARSFTVLPRPAAVPYSVKPEKAVTPSHGIDAGITWDAATCPSPGYHIIYGYGSGLAGWSVAGGVCGIGTTGTYAWKGVPSPAGDASRFLWFLVVGDDGGATEGSWGLTSAGAQRGAGASGVCGMTNRDTGTTCSNP